jgi:Domain of unknown function (DUF4276)
MNPTVIEILTEEPSMEYFLRGLLPRILPGDYALDQNCFIRPHEGKSDLKKSIPRKMSAYQHFGYPVKVLIVHDQDANDCVLLKKDLLALSKPTSVPILVRIACRELENWYLGDFSALEQVYPEIRASELYRKAKFRNPDNVFGSKEIKSLSNNFTKTGAARVLGPIIDVSENNSPSFQQFITGLSKLLELKSD